MPTPRLAVHGPRAGARAVVLLLPGGPAQSTRPGRRGAGYLRMVPFARAVAAAVAGRRVAVWLLRYRVAGWNEPDRDPVRDARWALGEARRRHPGATLVLVGHSMGGRVALRLAGEPGVAGVCALAPWLEPGEPVPPRGAARVLVVHGRRDRMTSPAMSAGYASRAGAVFVPVPCAGHGMLWRPGLWTRLTVGFVLRTLHTARPGAYSAT